MAIPSLPFASLYRHGFARVTVAVPRMALAEPRENARRTLELARAASEDRAVLALFPELGLSGYSLDDLFQQDALLEAVEAALGQVVAGSRDLLPLLLVGAPLRFDGQLFNCAVAIHRGRVLGVIPKSYLPNYREFYEKRQFTAARSALHREVTLFASPLAGAGDDLSPVTVPFGNDLLFAATDLSGFVLHGEICEDLWTPLPPSTVAALGGATVLANLSASNITIGKADYRRDLCAGQSARCLAAYLYAAAGAGESTTDLAWDGHGLIYENGKLLAESERFRPEAHWIAADLDLELLVQERSRLTSFSDTAHDHRDLLAPLRRVPFSLDLPTEPVPLRRRVERFPYVPAEPARRDERCREAFEIQVAGLVQRLEATGIGSVVLGISGGLDSTHALLVCCRAFDRLGLPRGRIRAYTLPGFATSDTTRANAWRLMGALGVRAEEIDIRPAARQMLEDLGHPFAAGEAVHDVTFENVQAGQRTAHLFRLANHHGALVVGTGDLSEIALGWSTYGVGDQMSHYNVNASVPKTLIQHLVRWVAEQEELEDDLADGEDLEAVLLEILDTEISPELVPAGSGEEGAGDGPQATEAVIGPYELQDFHLYHVSRYGFRPSKVAFLCHHAWGDRERGPWPPGFPEESRRSYDLAAIKRWLRVFLERFFATSQFKRSASPNGPKVGSGGSLSPRGDWRAPSDVSAKAWLEELETGVPDRPDEEPLQGANP